MNTINILFSLILISCELSKNLNNEKYNSSKKEFESEFEKADYAIINVELELLKEAVNKDRNILKMIYNNFKDCINNGYTLLMYSLKMEKSNPSIHGNKDITQYLLNVSDSDDLNANICGESVLHLALFNEDYVNYILNKKNSYLDINMKNECIKNYTPLMLGVNEGYLESVKILIEQDSIKIELKDDDNNNLLHIIAIGINDKCNRISRNMFYKDNENKKKSYEKANEDYKKILKLLKESNKFNFSEASKQQNKDGKTPSILFEELIKKNIEKRIYTKKHWEKIKNDIFPLLNEKY